ncbi:G-protein coupled receptor 55-like [Neopelma chrysocephalum]|uniref:G-protein coupled receptor 55-like n=1 Tax=Neopelma chrysocephalum TaxID=114329 RepID=UPI000FCD0729|nr:G-protein coupled receptor 55-like [Neopelma chrysocephalum]
MVENWLTSPKWNCIKIMKVIFFSSSIPGVMNDTHDKSNISATVEWFQFIMYIPTFSLGLLFNVMALLLLFFKVKKLSESTVYMIALIFLDTLLLFTLPFKIISYHRQWNLGSVFCEVLESLYFVNMYGSILISLCICVDRYIAIQHPFTAPSLRSIRKAAMVCAVVCLGTSVGTVSTSRLHEKGQDISSCFHNFSPRTWADTGLFSTLETIFFGSMAAMTFCTAQTVRCLRRHRDPDNPQTHITRAERIVVTNLVAFLVCFTPYHVAYFMYFLVKRNIICISFQKVLRDVVQITLCWANLNCCLDGMCYYFVLKESLEEPSQNTERRVMPKP